MVALTGQQVRLAGEVGEDETALAERLFADGCCTIGGAEVPQALTQRRLSETPRAARHKAPAGPRHTVLAELHDEWQVSDCRYLYEA